MSRRYQRPGESDDAYAEYVAAHVEIHRRASRKNYLRRIEAEAAAKKATKSAARSFARDRRIYGSACFAEVLRLLRELEVEVNHNPKESE